MVKQNRDRMAVTEEQMDAICTSHENFIGWYVGVDMVNYQQATNIGC